MNAIPLPPGAPPPDSPCAVRPEWDVGPIVAQLRTHRQRWRERQGRSLEYGVRELPSLEALRSIVQCLKGALFPLRLGPPELRQEGEDYYVGHTIESAMQRLLNEVRQEMRLAARRAGKDPAGAEGDSVRIVTEFAATLPRLRELLDSDVIAAFEGDPAARSADEVLVCYPGVTAMIHHRIAHELYRLQVPILARMVAEIAHSQTGIDIHPGATIGPSFFIDHGTGVVIGETAIIGKNVRLYQNVTLGAKRFPVSADGTLEKNLPRHPIVEDEVVIYAGATILGRVTVGKGSSIGGNVWLTRSVPAGSQITQANSQNLSHASDPEKP